MIKTSDNTWRRETSAERLAKAIAETDKEREIKGAKGRVGKLNWKLLWGLKNPMP